jgi:replicative DNA helicase
MKAIDTETIALATMILYPDLLIECPYQIEAMDFQDSQNRAVFEAWKQLRDQGATLVGSVAIFRQLQKMNKAEMVDATFLKDLFTFAETTIDSLMVLKEVSFANQISLFCMRTHANLKGGSGALDQLSEVKKFVDGMHRTAIQSSGSISLKQAVAEIVEIYSPSSEAGTQSAVLIPTGFAEFDAEMGGIAGGEMVVFAARPGQGKTVIANQLARASAQAGFPSNLIGLEMKVQQNAKRQISQITGINPTLFRRRSITQEDIDLIKKQRELYDIPMTMSFQPGIGPRALLSMVELFFQSGGKMVLIDYLQRVNFKMGNMDQEIGQLTGELKSLALKYDGVVVLFSQVNREVEDELKSGRWPKPQMKHLKNSGYIEADADIIWSILNFGYYKIEYDNDKPLKGITRLFSLKCREKRFRDIDLHWNEETQSLDNKLENKYEEEF